MRKKAKDILPFSDDAILTIEEPYKNLSGSSNIETYELGADFIWVRFIGGARYLYTYEALGRENIEQMKQLAQLGRGLQTLIRENKTIYYGFSEKNWDRYPDGWVHVDSAPYEDAKPPRLDHPS